MGEEGEGSSLATRREMKGSAEEVGEQGGAEEPLFRRATTGLSA